MKARKAQNSSEWGIAVLVITVICIATLFTLAPRMKGIIVSINDALNRSAGSQQQQP